MSSPRAVHGTLLSVPSNVVWFVDLNCMPWSCTHTSNDRFTISLSNYFYGYSVEAQARAYIISSDPKTIRRGDFHPWVNVGILITATIPSSQSPQTGYKQPSIDKENKYHWTMFDGVWVSVLPSVAYFMNVLMQMMDLEIRNNPSGILVSAIGPLYLVGTCQSKRKESTC